MLRLMNVAAVLAVAGCVTPNAPPVSGKLNHADNLIPGCYTVDLFDPYRIEYPAANVPREMSNFLGVWKNAGWNGNWCHDLYITEVRADGTVTLLDAYGPNKGQGLEATVFKRTARIENGVLKFKSIGYAPVSYELAEGGHYLLGNRTDAAGRYKITMNRVDGIAVVPVPPEKPDRQVAGTVRPKPRS